MSNQNIHQRLDAIEDQLRKLGGSDPEVWRELRERFCAIPDNAALLATLASYAGSRSLPRLIRFDPDDARVGSLVGELRRRLGAFCREHKLRCPEAGIVYVRQIKGQFDRSIVTVSGPESEHPFLQLFEVRRDQ